LGSDNNSAFFSSNRNGKKFRSGIRDPRWKKSATLISSYVVGSSAPRVRVRAVPHHLQEPGLPQGALTQARRQAFRLRPLRQGVPQPQEPPHAQEGSPPARGEVSILILIKHYRNFYAKKRINRYGSISCGSKFHI
jgi:hypothetical protein